MPRYDVDRNVFVNRITQKRRWVGRVTKVLRKLKLVRKPVQAVIYDTVFRSDEEVVNYAYAVRNDHLPDLDNPRWFNEKIRWTFLHHDNPLVALVADKISVRDYIRFRGGKIEGPKLYAYSSEPRDLLTADLPGTFALKSAYGSGQNHLEKPGMRTPRADLAAKARSWMGWDQWRSTGEFHYRHLHQTLDGRGIRALGPRRSNTRSSA